jgi:SNF2 family DNA or RNA helicase
LIISYEKFRQYADQFEEINCGLVVCDEGHRLKNSAIKTTQALKNLPTKRRIILTG